MTNAVMVIVGLVAVVLSDLRWFRVAQREHYIAGSASRFAGRWWWGSGMLNRLLAMLVMVAFVCASVVPDLSVIAAVVLCVGPIGLGIRGRTSKLAITKRMRMVVLVTVVLQLATVGLLTGIDGWQGAWFGLVLVALLAPTVIDVALLALAPLEARRLRPFVESASSRLKNVNPTVVAITGSYGKTTTKNYVNAMLSQSFTVVATPASFNNRAGLSRAINENLTPGTDVFIAEMGTYGKGEIKELCEFCPPRIAVLTAVGPVHLERFRTEEAIIKAKSEIFVNAEVCVINVDDERLAAVADDLAADGKKVWRCSTRDVEADVCVRPTNAGLEVFAGGQQLFDAGESDAIASSVAVSMAVGFELGLSVEQIATGLSSLPLVPHRGEVQKGSNGQTVIDDTFNANPASVQRVIDLIDHIGGQRRVLVTPGMVELGPRQDRENYAFARNSAAVVTELIVVGKTNRRALKDGARDAGASIIAVDSLTEAVAWVRKNTHEGDVVAYVNDLPDHFP